MYYETSKDAVQYLLLSKYLTIFENLIHKLI